MTKNDQLDGPRGIRTHGARFKVWSDNHYTIGPQWVAENNAGAIMMFSFSKALIILFKNTFSYTHLKHHIGFRG